jgi:hypothetical protein
MVLKSVQWEPSSYLLTDRQAEITKLIAAFRNFAKAPKMHSDGKISFFKEEREC